MCNAKWLVKSSGSPGKTEEGSREAHVSLLNVNATTLIHQFTNFRVNQHFTAGKRSMAKLTSHELSNIVKKICLIFTVTDRRLLSQNFSHICCQLTELTPTYSLATPGDLVTTFSTNPRLKCQPGMWSPTSLGNSILNPSYLKNTSAE